MAVLAVGAETITGPIQANDSAPESITTSTTRPYSLADMDVDSALILNAINKKLQIESTLDDIFVDVGADVVFVGKKINVPDAVVMRLKTGTVGEHTQILPMLHPLTGPGRGGVSEAQQGYERGMMMKYMQVFYNEYSQGVAGEEWGVAYNQVQLFDLYGQIQPILSKWFKEDLGRQYREAALLTYAWPLTKAGVTNMTTGKTQHWNPNWYIANLADGDQPAYSSTLNTMTGYIATAMQAADTGTAGVNANIDLDYLLALENYAANTKRITPLTIGGRKSYIVLLPSSQYYKLLSTNNGQLGSIWENVSALSSEEQNFPGIVGRVRSLVIVEDQRYPTLEFNGSGGAADYAQTTIATTGPGATASDGASEVSVEFVAPGNEDNRNKTVYDSTSNAAWSIGSLFGAPAIVDWDYTSLHFETEKTEYGKKYGKAAFCERGIQLALYKDDATADSYVANFGSIVLAFTNANVATTA